jgi:hypothetical protein
MYWTNLQSVFPRVNDPTVIYAVTGVFWYIKKKLKLPLDGINHVHKLKIFLEAQKKPLRIPYPAALFITLSLKMISNL